MQIKSESAERLLKSFGFSVALFLFWGTWTVLRGRSLLERFELAECAWVVYNATISMLFLVRSRPSVVSMDPVHWLVALATSFSGMFFHRYVADPPPLRSAMADCSVYAGLLASGVAAVSLGRSYDFLPALRGVQTRWLYGLVRHPMYLSAMVIRLGYLLRHCSYYNLVVFLVMVWLYVKRAAFEETIMRNDPRYREYTEKVPYKFLPGLH